ncbi:Uncharacterised protein [Kingella negevensis]|uniref:Uncharacterized protein n=1 Tax=Kingella negevensis TaxID=1522312 RepID=A0A238HJR1_9NEIS|nr:Uncharacterised protein [Kingella negevensis]
MVRFFVEIKFYSFAIFYLINYGYSFFLNEMSTRPNFNNPNFISRSQKEKNYT